jgi:hypothetical protein
MVALGACSNDLAIVRHIPVVVVVVVVECGRGRDVEVEGLWAKTQYSLVTRFWADNTMTNADKTLECRRTTSI